MSTEFVQALSFLGQVWNSGNNTNFNTSTCISAIKHQDFHLYLIIPACVLCAILSFSYRRKYKLLQCLDGRPAFVYPMDILGRSNRLSYAAAYGAIAHLCLMVVFEQKYAFRYDGPIYLKAFLALASMLIYGLGYSPLFMSLAVNTTLGYIIGTLYAWMLTGVILFQTFECPVSLIVTGMIVLRNLPQILCFAYLSVSLPIRAIMSIHKYKCERFAFRDDGVSLEKLNKLILNSYQGVAVRKIFIPPKPPPPPPETVPQKIAILLKGILNDWLYHKNQDFRYSSRVLFVMIVGLILIYEVSVELLVGFLPLIKFLEMMLWDALELTGWYNIPGEETVVKETRDWLYLGYYFIIAGRASLIVSVALACALGIVMILHMLSSYRTNLLALHKGDNSHIPPRLDRSNASLLVGSMRYAGYQVGYIAWAYFIQFLIFFLLCIVISVIVILFQLDMADWLIKWIMGIWPVLLTTLVINIIQIILAKFLFLQERGDVLAIDNRRFFFVFVYYMFFYNIFMGLVSCLLRIGKSVLIGALFMSRLDNSSLPRRFQFFDPGFAAYVGFIHVENAHTHPVLLTFIRILQANCYYRKSRTASSLVGIQNETLGSSVRRRSIVQLRWMLLYTLYNNPSLRAYRKDYIDAVKNKLEDVELKSIKTTSEKDDFSLSNGLKFISESARL